MRHAKLSMLGLVALSLLSACGRGMNDAEVQKAMKDVNVIDESNLSDIMLTVSSGALMCRCVMPVRSRIQLSLVSIRASRSALVSIFRGR